MSDTDDWDREPVLPEQTADDTDAAWGEHRQASEQDQEDLDRLREDRPPHYDK